MWSYHNPVRIHFGTDSFDSIAGLIAGRSYAVVTYDEPYFHDLVGRLAAAVGAAGMLIDNITPNPDFAMLDASCAQLTGDAEIPEVIVCVGGGSVMDAGKVLAERRGLWSWRAICPRLRMVFAIPPSMSRSWIPTAICPVWLPMSHARSGK